LTDQIRSQVMPRLAEQQSPEGTAPRGCSVIDRLMFRTALLSNGCWEWRGCVNHRGYGLAWDGKKLRIVHRVAYEELVGPIPDGLQIDHLCRNRPCINPAHLEPVTALTNVLRSANGERGKNLVAMQASKTHCPQGHPYSGDNLYTSETRPRSGRQCKECRRAATRRWSQRNIRKDN
jgi:hypothetical protein